MSGFIVTTPDGADALWAKEDTNRYVFHNEKVIRYQYLAGDDKETLYLVGTVAGAAAESVFARRTLDGEPAHEDYLTSYGDKVVAVNIWDSPTSSWEVDSEGAQTIVPIPGATPWSYDLDNQSQSVMHWYLNGRGVFDPTTDVDYVSETQDEQCGVWNGVVMTNPSTSSYHTENGPPNYFLDVHIHLGYVIDTDTYLFRTPESNVVPSIDYIGTSWWEDTRFAWEWKSSGPGVDGDVEVRLNLSGGGPGVAVAGDGIGDGHTLAPGGADSYNDAFFNVGGTLYPTFYVTYWDPTIPSEYLNLAPRLKWMSIGKTMPFEPADFQVTTWSRSEYLYEPIPELGGLLETSQWGPTTLPGTHELHPGWLADGGYWTAVVAKTQQVYDPNEQLYTNSFTLAVNGPETGTIVSAIKLVRIRFV